MPYPGLSTVAQQIGFQGPAGALSTGGGLTGFLSRIKPEQLQAIMGLLSVGQGLQRQGLQAGQGSLGLGDPAPDQGPALQGYQFGRPSNPPLAGVPSYLPTGQAGGAASSGGEDDERRRMLTMLMLRLGGGGLG